MIEKFFRKLTTFIEKLGRAFPTCGERALPKPWTVCRRYRRRAQSSTWILLLTIPSFKNWREKGSSKSFILTVPDGECQVHLDAESDSLWQIQWRYFSCACYLQRATRGLPWHRKSMLKTQSAVRSGNHSCSGYGAVWPDHRTQSASRKQKTWNKSASRPETLRSWAGTSSPPRIPRA